MANWILADDNIEIEQELRGVPVSVLKIMKRRGVPEEMFEDFVSVAPKNTYDPFLLPDLKEVCERILAVCREGKRICVYGDYDADGVTSTTLMFGLLKHFTDNVTYYIPSRFDDGYGPNKEAFKKIAADGVEVLITVDCGITSGEEIEFAKSLGMECIVTDHHILRDGMTPDCLTVNPRRSDSIYPYAELSGCGVAFKIAQGIERMCEGMDRSVLNGFLDLVAISTVADVVPLLDENRTLVKYGLEMINRRQRRGLDALMTELSLEGPIDASGISFVIAPNINALGRMGSAAAGVELLSGYHSDEELAELAAEIAETNRRRKKIQEETARICRDVLENDDPGEYAPVIYAPGAHEGVAGIVAGSLKEELNKPVCIVSPAEDGTLKGTGRSTPGINLHMLFENCGDVFDRFGGHAGACGFTVKEGKLEEFRAKMQELVKELVDKDPSVLEKSLYIEKELEPEELTLSFAKSLSLLEPFGEGNPVPIFCVRFAKVTDFRKIGSEGQHLKFTVKTQDGIYLSCISFWGSDKFYDIVSSGLVDVAGELNINEYRGRRQLQMKVADVRESYYG